MMHEVKFNDLTVTFKDVNSKALFIQFYNGSRTIHFHDREEMETFITSLTRFNAELDNNNKEEVIHFIDSKHIIDAINDKSIFEFDTIVLNFLYEPIGLMFFNITNIPKIMKSSDLQAFLKQNVSIV